MASSALRSGSRPYLVAIREGRAFRRRVAADCFDGSKQFIDSSGPAQAGRTGGRPPQWEEHFVSFEGSPRQRAGGRRSSAPGVSQRAGRDPGSGAGSGIAETCAQEARGPDAELLRRTRGALRARVSARPELARLSRDLIEVAAAYGYRRFGCGRGDVLSVAGAASQAGDRGR